MTIPSLLNDCNRMFIKQLKTNEKKHFHIVHHWDTDGILSAVLIEKFLRKIIKNPTISFVIPTIGEHSINSFIVSPKKNHSLFIIDYGIPIKDIEKTYCDKGVETYIVDHHKNVIPPVHKSIVCNPVAYGATEKEYPSTTIVIKKLIDTDADEFLVILGIIGDLEQNILQNSYYPWVKKILDNNNITLQEAIKITKVIDSCYKILDKKCILHTIETLRKEKPTVILQDRMLKNNLELISDEIEKITNDETKTELLGNMILVKAKSKYYVTSEVGRRLSSKYPDKIIIFYNIVERMKTAYIYVRSKKYNVGEIIQYLKNKGFLVGGKDHVFVVACKNQCEKKRNIVINLLLKKFAKQ